MSSKSNGHSPDSLLYADEYAEKLKEGRLYTGSLSLMGTWELAKYLGVEKSRIARWLNENEAGKDSVPSPIARLKCGPLWTREQAEHKRLQMSEERGKRGRRASAVAD